MHLNACRRCDSGFTLIEVMVALIIIAIGMLGIAKLQGLVMSNTGVARMRSLAALQATSLASAMHANRAFWASTTNAQTFTNTYDPVAKTNNPGGTAALGTAGACQAPAVCTSDAVAGADLYTWITSLNNNLPNASEAVTCLAAPPAPTACKIEIKWVEQMVNSDQLQVQPVANAAITTPTYDLDVVP